MSKLETTKEIFDSIGLKECIDDSIINNSKILLELKEQVKEEIDKSIEEQVRPIARKKPQKEIK